MGNDVVQFTQSLSDFPLTVALGNKSPSWGLFRWRGDSGLRFLPFDNEGFTIRGDKKRLLYKGRKRSHKFTILGDTAFEYDCILENEPESNVVSLLMEGAENFDFFRQPDFVCDPFLKGSYAVYKKETLLGQGTGKLCHIHRPLIIDARGRKVWGDLSVVENELRITIPEQWLSEAKYPVVVDPVVGTTQIGSQNRWVEEPGNPPEELYFELSIPVNRFLIPETINGQCTGFYYVNQDDWDGGGRGVLYSDNNNQPQTRRSANENFINMRVNANNPAGWRSGTFNSNGSIASGSQIWFGLFAEYMWFPRFDYGMRCFTGGWFDGIPNTYPPLPPWASFFDFRLSMYFEYSSAQNYVRTLTQGLTVRDTKKHTGNYRRVTTQLAFGSDVLKSYISKIRTIIESLGISDQLQKSVGIFRLLYLEAASMSEILRYGKFYRIKNETVKAQGSVIMSFFIYVKILTTTLVRDFVNRKFVITQKELKLKSKITISLSLESKI